MDLILYGSGETSFTTLGLGVIQCTEATVTEELNGKFEIEFKTPITGRHYSDIVEGCIVTAPHDDTKHRQPFVIYKRSAPLNGLVTFYGRHISYRLLTVSLQPFTATSCSAAMAGMETYAINPRGFTFWTDVTTTGTFKISAPAQCRKMLGGSEGSVLDVFGGEYEFDGFTVKLHSRRGLDTDVNIVYGKNLIDLKDDIDAGEIYNAVVPFWQSQDGTLVTVDGYLVKRADMQTGEPINAIVIDLTSDFQDQPTKAQLHAEASRRLASGRPWLSKRNVKVDFISLWQTSEYAHVAPLQRLNLGDTAVISVPALGITNERQKIIKTMYNVLTERYDKMELGQRQASFGQVIQAQTAEKLENVVTKSFLQQAIEYATKLITGGLGGHVVFTQNANGEPEEILIMDTDDVTTAVNVWRWNLNGLGHSHSGYNGPFDDVAITMDGQINANMITTGTLLASMIYGGVLTLGGPDNGNGVLRVLDSAGNQIGKWDKDGADITGDLNLYKLVDYVHSMANLADATFKFEDESVTRYGFRVASRYGVETNATGEIVISPGNQLFPSGVQTVENGYNIIHSKQRLAIQSEASVRYLGAWSSIEFQDGSFYLMTGNQSEKYYAIRVERYNAETVEPRITINADYLQLPKIIYTDLPVSTGSPNVLNDFSGAGQLVKTGSSSKRYKEDISLNIPDNMNPQRLYDLQVKTFKYKDGYLMENDRNNGKKVIGFIAEEVNDVYPIACQYDKDGRPEMWNVMFIVPAMLKLIQEQKAKIDEFETRIARLEALILKEE